MKKKSCENEMENFLSGIFFWFLEIHKHITTTNAQTFKEQERAKLVQNILNNIGFTSRFDEVGNLIVEINGENKNTLVFSAHLDTVFYEEIALNYEEKDGKIYAPSAADNSVGIASLLVLLKYIKEKNIKPMHDTIILFNVCEEAVGNLQGIKHFLDHFDKKLKIHICIEGAQLGRITTKAIGSYRAKIKIKGPGGHSYSNFGNPNPIKTAAEIITGLDGLKENNFSYNFGTIKGGSAVNAIPEECEFTYEIRSTDGDIITKIKNKAKSIIKSHDKTPLKKA